MIAKQTKEKNKLKKLLLLSDIDSKHTETKPQSRGSTKDLAIKKGKTKDLTLGQINNKQLMMS
jgi:hypothetical protein